MKFDYGIDLIRNKANEQRPPPHSRTDEARKDEEAFNPEDDMSDNDTSIERKFYLSLLERVP